MTQTKPPPPPPRFDNLEIIPYCSKQKAQTTILYFTTHPTQNLERIIVRAKKIVYKPPEFNYHFALLRSLLVAVLRHIREVYGNAPIREAEDYQRRKKGEVDTQKYPNFPILRERAKYKRDCIMQDKIQRKQACQKEFPSHSKLTPGLYLLTCGCTQKTIYGFSMMLSGENSGHAI